MTIDHTDRTIEKDSGVSAWLARKASPSVRTDFFQDFEHPN
jgi:hypothetical protein